MPMRPPASHVRLLYCRLDAFSAPSARETERTASLGLARELAGPDAQIEHFADGAPYIAGFDGCISISHGAGYCVIVASQSGTVGVDVERWREQLKRVACKFLSDDEIAVWGSDDLVLLRAWTIKEAVYKAARTPGLALKEICLPPCADGDEAQARGVVYRLHTQSVGEAMVTTAWVV
jgi:4'-phosphopantetheinyl transferase family protein